MKPAKTALWNELFPDSGFIATEVKLAFSYYHDDKPDDEPDTLAGWSRAVSSWLKRSWITHQREKERVPNTRVLSSVKTDRWDALAGKVLSAIDQFPAGDDRTADLIGDDWQWVSRSRLMSSARSSERNEFGRKRLAKDLCEAYKKFEALKAADA